MCNLLIVDDEKNIRDGLKAMIRREFGDAYALHFAANGQQALQVMDGTEMDLVITDIRMPVMDGIELINRLQDQEPGPDLVILSGHDDFQYAKAAIRCNVKEYLLKPIVRDELFRTLRRLDAERIRKGEIADQLRGTKALKENYAVSRLQYLFLQEGMDEHGIRDVVLQAGLDWLDAGGYAALVLVPERYRDSGWDEFTAYVDLMIGWLPGERYIRFYDKDGKLVVFTDTAAPFNRLGEAIIRQSASAIRAGISEQMSGAGEVKRAYQQAGRALKYFLFQNMPGLIWSTELSGKRADYRIPLEDIRKTANLLGLDRDAELSRLLQHIFDIRTILQYDIGYLEGIGRAFNEHVFDQVFQTYGEESVDILKLHKQVGNLYNFNHFHDYFHGLESLIFLLSDYVKRMRSMHFDQNEIQRAIVYIEEHYHENVNMAVVSNHVSLNYSYFSHAFKEYTGETFVSYLRKLRIRKAKELLNSTDLKVYEISEQAGFENVKHFTRVFKEMEGVAPLEYRSQQEALRRR
ncbi:two-component system response regulator YesN [Paenibacillus rhizosphaerae]|uniref:Two-component system response regulator YesN n=1 Tax=Paenibacillus rhizosphaerae TaxID=297318 RepID=A0A839TM67_9BACL|nr:response regulator [Paenibacillus rhizosphaerae]MBB3126439.1 two-component system response regulator YesN [Paenibacillus rhizosphaerae]